MELAHFMSRRNGWLRVLSAVVILLAAAAGDAAEPKPAAAPPANPAETSPVDKLAVEQGKIADKYSRLEQLMVRMAEIEAGSNPERSALLKRAVKQSSERLTRQQLNKIVGLLTPPAKLGNAIDEQQKAVVDVRALLELLKSENRPDRLKDEQTRLREYVKEVERLIRLQQGVQGRTEGGDETRKLSDDQAKVSERTGKLAQQIRETEERSENQAGQKPSQDPAKPTPAGKPEGGKETPESKPASSPKNGKPAADGQTPSSRPQDKPPSGPPGKTQDGQPGKRQDGQPGQDGDQAGGQPQDAQQKPMENPARKRLEQARERMQAAQKKLDEAQRKQAVEEQEAARRELEKAKAELEEILRQLREEELERTLALLEGRFRRMLEMQVRIHESTKRLDEIPAAQRGRDVDLQAGKLSAEENQLVTEADKALLLLREEGSSVAFPETVEQMRGDMVQVTDRLAATKVDRITQNYEEDVIAALEEMIAALQKAQQDLEKQRQQQQQQPQMIDPQDVPLVDGLAELKMIRALQMRVNTRTKRYAELLKNANDPIGRAEDEELRQALVKLAEKEQRIFEVTRNLVLEKNR